MLVAVASVAVLSLKPGTNLGHQSKSSTGTIDSNIFGSSESNAPYKIIKMQLVDLRWRDVLYGAFDSLDLKMSESIVSVLRGIYFVQKQQQNNSFTMVVT